MNYKCATIELLFDELNWSQFGTASHLQYGYKRLLKERLDQLVGSIPPKAEDIQAFVAVVESLSNQALDLYLLNPYVARVLLGLPHFRGTPHTRVNLLGKALLSFVAHDSERSNGGMSGFDIWFSNINQQRLHINLDRGIYLPPEIGTNLVSVPNDMRDSVISDLQKALVAINQVSHGLYEFVASFTRLFVFRNDYVVEQPASGSFRGLPGLSVFVNCTEITEIELLIDSIIHESIHSLLFTTEVVNCERLVDLSEVVFSPWTGNPITVDNFLQAIYVWYGLFHFWQLALGKGMAGRCAEKYLARAQTGFHDAVVTLKRLPLESTCVSTMVRHIKTIAC